MSSARCAIWRDSIDKYYDVLRVSAPVPPPNPGRRQKMDGEMEREKL